MAVRSIDLMPGIQPELREYLSLMQDAMSGDIVIVIDPETVDRTITSSAWDRDVKISIQNAAGKVHKWMNLTEATILSVGDTGGGTAIIVATTITIVNGETTVVVSGDAATWADAETDTLTVATMNLLGYAIAGGTSVETFNT